MGRSSRYHYRPNTSDYQTIIFKSSQKLHMPPHRPSLGRHLRRPLTGSTGSLAPCADPWARASAGAASDGRPGNRLRAASSPLSQLVGRAARSPGARLLSVAQHAEPVFTLAALPHTPTPSIPN